MSFLYIYMICFLDKYDVFPGDILWLSRRYLMGFLDIYMMSFLYINMICFLDIYDGCPGDI